MYNIVRILLVISTLIGVFNFLKFLTGPGLNQMGVYISGWTLSVGLIPSLAVSILVLVLFHRKNAASFWVYLATTIMFTSGAIHLIASLPKLSASTSSQSLSDFLSPSNIATIVMLVMLCAKLLICWAMWTLIKRGEINYQPD